MTDKVVDSENEPEEVNPLLSHPAVGTEVDSKFPDEWKKEFEGLAYLGYLTSTVRIPFHTFHLKTLLPTEKIEVGMICRSVEGTLAYAKAFKAAIVAAALISVDGQPLIASERTKGFVSQKYEYVINSWYDPIIDLLYNSVNALESRSIVVLQEMGVLGVGGNIVTFDREKND